MKLLRRKRAQTEAAVPPATTVVERRLEIYVEREWAAVPGDASAGDTPCAVCGDTRSLTLGEAADRLGEGLDGLHRFLESGAVHLHQSGSNEIAVCARSVRQKK